MNTLSLAFVLHRNEGSREMVVVTIVCHSEDNIDQLEVQRVAVEYLNQAFVSRKTMDLVFRDVVSGIRSACGVQAVIVKADCVAEIFFQ